MGLDTNRERVLLSTCENCKSDESKSIKTKAGGVASIFVVVAQAKEKTSQTAIPGNAYKSPLRTRPGLDPSGFKQPAV